jgi:hypothetical protein
MNSRLWLVPSQLDPQAMVHAVFFDAWESVKNEVYTAIDDNGMSKLILCGHFRFRVSSRSVHRYRQ